MKPIREEMEKKFQQIDVVILSIAIGNSRMLRIVTGRIIEELVLCQIPNTHGYFRGDSSPEPLLYRGAPTASTITPSSTPISPAASKPTD